MFFYSDGRARARKLTDDIPLEVKRRPDEIINKQREHTVRASATSAGCARCWRWKALQEIKEQLSSRNDQNKVVIFDKSYYQSVT